VREFTQLYIIRQQYHGNRAYDGLTMSVRRAPRVWPMLCIGRAARLGQRFRILSVVLGPAVVQVNLQLPLQLTGVHKPHHVHAQGRR